MSSVNTTNHFWNLMDNNQNKINKGWNGANQYTFNNLSSGKITPIQASLVALFNGCCRGVTRNTVNKLLNNVLCLAKELDSVSYSNTIGTCFNIFVHCRDCRGGKGEKDASRYLLCELFINFPDETLAIIHLIPEYGYWKDYNLIIQDCFNKPEYNKLINSIYTIMYKQIIDDNNTLDKQSDNKLKLSLLAKWIPKEGRSMDRKYGITNRLAQLAFPEMYNKNKSTALKKWRKIVSRLNKTIHTVEILMSTGDFDKIKFSLVPGRVTNICKKAFLNLKGGKNSKSNSPRSNSPRRITGRCNMLSHISAAKNSNSSMKGKSLHLHEIVRSMLSLNGYGITVNNGLSSEEKDLLQCQWNDHRNTLFKSIKEGLEKCDSDSESESIFDPKGIIMIDESASMMCGETPILAANAIGIMLTELCAEFGGKILGNRFLTFDSIPQWVTLPDTDSLFEKLNIASKTLWGGNTNFLAAHNMILELCINHNLTPADLPKWFMVLSDMQFDCANQASRITKGNIIDTYCDKDILNRLYTQNATHHEILVSAYKNVGLRVCGKPYTLPYTYYWNLTGKTNGCPVQADTPNTMMLSGFSTEMISLLFSGKIAEANSDNTTNSWDLLVAAMETKNKDGTFRYITIHNALKEYGGLFTDYIIPFADTI